MASISGKPVFVKKKKHRLNFHFSTELVHGVFFSAEYPLYQPVFVLIYWISTASPGNKLFLKNTPIEEDLPRLNMGLV